VQVLISTTARATLWADPATGCRHGTVSQNHQRCLWSRRRDHHVSHLIWDQRINDWVIEGAVGLGGGEGRTAEASGPLQLFRRNHHRSARRSVSEGVIPSGRCAADLCGILGPATPKIACSATSRGPMNSIRSYGITRNDRRFDAQSSENPLTCQSRKRGVFLISCTVTSRIEPRKPALEACGMRPCGETGAKGTLGKTTRSRDTLFVPQTAQSNACRNSPGRGVYRPPTIWIWTLVSRLRTVELAGCVTKRA